MAANHESFGREPEDQFPFNGVSPEAYEEAYWLLVKDFSNVSLEYENLSVDQTLALGNAWQSVILANATEEVGVFAGSSHPQRRLILRQSDYPKPDRHFEAIPGIDNGSIHMSLRMWNSDTNKLRLIKTLCIGREREHMTRTTFMAPSGDERYYPFDWLYRNQHVTKPEELMLFSRMAREFSSDLLAVVHHPIDMVPDTLPENWQQ